MSGWNQGKNKNKLQNIKNKLATKLTNYTKQRDYSHNTIPLKMGLAKKTP